MNRDIPWLRPAAEYSLLVPASLFGILARLGLEAVSDCESTYNESNRFKTDW
jgi:hypothetical protein